MARRNEHLIVIMLEPMPAGHQFEIWPLHLTIVPWFHAEDETNLDKLLETIAKKHPAFSIETGPREVWGKKEKFEVVVVADEGGLHRLHRDIFHGLEKNGFLVHQKDFLGHKYRPHITVRNLHQKTTKTPLIGEQHRITNFALIKQVRLKKTGRMIKSLKKEYQLS